MLMKQVEVQEIPDGGRTILWIDQEHAIPGHRFDFNLGDGKRSPVVQVIKAWDTVRDLTEITEQQAKNKGFGGSIR